MAGDGAYFAVEYDHVSRVARRLTEVSDALSAAVTAATDLHAVASPGFISVAAALGCARAWLVEVERLTATVDQARARLSDSVSTYRESDVASHGEFRALDAGIGG